MFKPTDAQITEFLDRYLKQYKIKEIERIEGDEDDVIFVTVEIMLKYQLSITPAVQMDLAPFEITDTKVSMLDTLEFTRERLITHQLPPHPVLYVKWLAANGWYCHLFQNNPFVKEEDVRDSD